MSFKKPEITFKINAEGVLSILEIIRNGLREARFFQASSADIFGQTSGKINEDTHLNPGSPYAVSKAAAHQLVKCYRESYGLFLVNGIMFPHESPRRNENFVSRKISIAVSKIKLGMQDKLKLGDTGVRRDWGYAPDYVNGMYASLKTDIPEDFVFSTGESHGLTELVSIAFNTHGLDQEKYVESDESLLRPVEIEDLVGDSSKARKILGWKPQKAFKDIVEEMVKSDYERLKKEAEK